MKIKEKRIREREKCGSCGWPRRTEGGFLIQVAISPCSVRRLIIYLLLATFSFDCFLREIRSRRRSLPPLEINFVQESRNPVAGRGYLANIPALERISPGEQNLARDLRNRFRSVSRVCARRQDPRAVCLILLIPLVRRTGDGNGRKEKSEYLSNCRRVFRKTPFFPSMALAISFTLFFLMTY